MVIEISGSGFSYTCGDSLGVYPANRAEEVGEILDHLEADGTEPVILPKMEEPVNFHEALTKHLSLAGPTKRFLKFLQSKPLSEQDAKKMEDLLNQDSAILREWLDQRHFIDVLYEFRSALLEPQEFVENTRKLVPRLYSIASSPTRYPNEIHLTVAVVRYESLGIPRHGVCSTYLADRVPLNEPVIPVFIADSHFGLPDDDSADMIMVGPGTGIAPFRAFLQERRERGATGKNWLFFGDQHETTDFLYGEELKAMVKDGILGRLDCAWSRDQDYKIYVQDKLRENAEEIASWLENGAYFFVCGDAKRMAKDVEIALREIISTQLGLNEDQTSEYIKDLKRAKRYMKDVY